MFMYPTGKLGWFSQPGFRYGWVLGPPQRAARMTKQALPTVEDSDPLFRTALAVEQDEQLAAEMSEWEAQTIGDGIGSQPYDRQSAVRGITKTRSGCVAG